MPNLIIETGVSVANANTYVEVEFVREFADLRGIELPVDDVPIEEALIKAFDYIESRETDFSGDRMSENSVFPRQGCVLFGNEIANTSIPRNLKYAQAQAAIILIQGVELQRVVEAGDYVSEEKIGPLTVKYADPLSVGIDASFGPVEDLLKPLFPQSKPGAFGGFSAVRV